MLTLDRRELLGFRREIPRRRVGDDHWLRVHRRAMACRFEVTLDSARAADLPEALAALDEAERIEAILTVFRPTSEVARVNAAPPGASTTVSEELATLLVRCRHLSDETGGAFDITTTPLSRAWGFLERRPARPAGDALAVALACVGMHRLETDRARRTVRFLSDGMALNFGSIGKGYAVARIAAALRAAGVRHALVSAGGSSVAALGTRRWRVDVTSRAAGRRLASLALSGAALATSGAGEQFIDVDGARRGHVLDPRTGWPAAGVMSASVVTDDAADADALATAFFVGGADLAASYCERHPLTFVLLAREGGDRPVAIGHHPSAHVEAL